MAQGTDLLDGLANFLGQGVEDQIAGGRKLKPGGKGIVDRDIWDTIWGRSQSELNTAYKTDQDDKLETKYKPQITALGGTFERGGSEGGYINTLRRLERKDTNDAWGDSPAGLAFTETNKRASDQLGIQTQELKNANTLAQGQLTLATKTAENQNSLMLAQMDQQNKDRGFDREMQLAQNNLTLQLGQMNSDLQDKRLQYDRETRSMDKRDRAIAQLMSGLGSLGGAFSLQFKY